MNTRIKLSKGPTILAALLLTVAPVAATAQNDRPLTERWAPTEWGAGDNLGSANRGSPALVLRAAQLIRQGKVATLGKVYQQDMPFFGNRSWTLTIPGLPTGGPIGPAQVVYNDEVVTTELGQVGTQFDGPGHVGVRTSDGDFFYNGHMLDDPAIGAYGMGAAGVEHVAAVGFVCRGVLLDAVAYRGGRLPVPTRNSPGDPGIMTAEDIEAMVEAQGIDPIGEGDCVFLYTGHGDIWHPTEWDTYDAAEKQRRSAEFNAGSPGFGMSACEYMAERGIMLWGSDTHSSEAVGSNGGGENPQPYECHMEMLARRGIWNIENLDLSQLVADRAFEFFFSWAPLKIKGGTGSPGNPVAVY